MFFSFCFWFCFSFYFWFCFSFYFWFCFSFCFWFCFFICLVNEFCKSWGHVRTEDEAIEANWVMCEEAPEAWASWVADDTDDWGVVATLMLFLLFLFPPLQHLQHIRLRRLDQKCRRFVFESCLCIDEPNAHTCTMTACHNRKLCKKYPYYRLLF